MRIPSNRLFLVDTLDASDITDPSGDVGKFRLLLLDVCQSEQMVNALSRHSPASDLTQRKCQSTKPRNLNELRPGFANGAVRKC